MRLAEQTRTTSTVDCFIARLQSSLAARTIRQCVGKTLARAVKTRREYRNLWSENPHCHSARAFEERNIANADPKFARRIRSPHEAEAEDIDSFIFFIFKLSWLTLWRCTTDCFKTNAHPHAQPLWSPCNLRRTDLEDSGHPRSMCGAQSRIFGLPHVLLGQRWRKKRYKDRDVEAVLEKRRETVNHCD
ncbi:hypothetical protein K432DRAFT_387386 [Lepidopterella palustris CBS 459.81]|uniref:Uncharacterized protein n=1 Tax=Lepidopterella palustris CBS 459.81 TaxID=1314670 RepID=A0A8E2J8Q3_9PEZI|nr:hypothetical protein K432DRAFT_387386 [Lepidopterella palustris CBS 459.81]